MAATMDLRNESKSQTYGNLHQGIYISVYWYVERCKRHFPLPMQSFPRHKESDSEVMMQQPKCGDESGAGASPAECKYFAYCFSTASLCMGAVRLVFNILLSSCANKYCLVVL